MAWHGMAWHGVVWHGMAWHGMAWHDDFRKVVWLPNLGSDNGEQRGKSKAIDLLGISNED
eukprot:scaffold28950_cov35-Prasinocladus_malaysianus.AAC.1